ncbi:MAG: Dabb family protein [Lentisphaeraceae bacterium]|nr:Dabb family protein [Lentisphaeraceae bacterium]
MFVHTVFFWLKDELSDDQKQAFFKGVDTLKTIQPNVMVTTGAPASTNRPIIDTSYDYGLTCIFKSLEDHDKYQVDPIHLKFVENHSNDWKKVLIYDYE